MTARRFTRDGVSRRILVTCSFLLVLSRTRRLLTTRRWATHLRLKGSEGSVRRVMLASRVTREESDRRGCAVSDGEMATSASMPAASVDPHDRASSLDRLDSDPVTRMLQRTGCAKVNTALQVNVSSQAVLSVGDVTVTDCQLICSGMHVRAPGLETVPALGSRVARLHGQSEARGSRPPEIALRPLQQPLSRSPASLF